MKVSKQDALEKKISELPRKYVGGIVLDLPASSSLSARLRTELTRGTKINIYVLLFETVFQQPWTNTEQNRLWEGWRHFSEQHNGLKRNRTALTWPGRGADSCTPSANA